jgi:hypothetical protein
MDDDGRGHALFTPTASGDRASHLADLFVLPLGISGASISVMDAGQHQSTISASDELAVRIDELQLTLGEGPRWDAVRAGDAVHCADTVGEAGRAWPVFGPAISELGVAAVFCIPLRLGAVTVGVVDLYRLTPGPLGGKNLATAWTLARAITVPAIRRAVVLAENTTTAGLGIAPEMRREVHQATGIILVQLDVTATEAFLRLRAHSYASGRPIVDVARDVVAHNLNFGELAE